MWLFSDSVHRDVEQLLGVEGWGCGIARSFDSQVTRIRCTCAVIRTDTWLVASEPQPPQTQHKPFPHKLPFLSSFFRSFRVLIMEVDSAPGAARRRRERRLRQLSKGGGERVELRHGPDDSSPRRPKLLVEVRPQGRVQWHTVEHIVDVSPFVQILDVPVPQVVEQPVHVLKLFDAAIPEHVIEVPWILCPSCFARFSVSRRWRSGWWKCRLSCLRPS